MRPQLASIVRKLRKLRRLRHLRVKFLFGGGDLTEVVDKSTWQTFLDGSPDLRQYHQSLEAVNGVQSDNFYKQLRFLSMMQALQLVLDRGIQGDFVECGVWRGHSAHMIASRLTLSGSTRKFHLFDSFEGLSQRGELDAARSQLTDFDRETERSYFAVGLAEVQSNLSTFSFIEYHPGWIPERFVEVEDRTFAFVHLDVDLFEPMFSAMEFFAPRLAAGGVIVVDDYGHSDFKGAKVAIDRYLADCSEIYKYEVPMGGAVLLRLPIDQLSNN